MPSDVAVVRARFQVCPFSNFVCRRLTVRLTIDERAVGMSLVEQAGLGVGGGGGDEVTR